MPKPKITYRTGGIELLDEIQPLWEQLNQHHAALSPHFSADFQTNTFAGRKTKLLKKYANGKLRTDITQFQGCKIGYLISAITADGIGEIESIYIKDDFRGQSIGDQLMQQALNWMDAHNVHTRLLDVAVGNERAYKFYARFGFYPRLVTLKQRIINLESAER